MFAAIWMPSVADNHSFAEPPLTDVSGQHYRIISSRFPPVELFEGLVAPERMQALFELEAMTNDRLRQQVGQLRLVKPEDRVSAPGASVVMAAFTHVSPNRQSRFSDGSYGVYYAARSLETAIRETCYHRERFLAATHEAPGEIDMRTYIGQIAKPLHDLRGTEFEALHAANDWTQAQRYGQQLHARGAWGAIYRSVRHPGGECIAALRPPAVTIPRQGPHLSYVWNGKCIAQVYRKRLIHSAISSSTE